MSISIATRGHIEDDLGAEVILSRELNLYNVVR